MTNELWAVLAAVVLGMVYVGADSFSFIARVGIRRAVGSRDDEPEREGVSGRLHRAARNYTENLALFVAVVFVLHASGQSSSLTQYGSYAWLGGRSLYLVAYAGGIPWTRTVCWQISMLGLVAMIAELFV